MVDPTHKQRLDALLKNGRRLVFPKKHQIISNPEKSTVYLVDKGYVKRYLITNDGDLSVQSIYGPGNVFPLTPIFKAIFDYEIYKGQETFYYETITDCELHSINERELLEAVAKDPLLYKDLFYVSGLRLESNIQKLENISLKSSRDRVYDLLLHLAKKFGTPEGDYYELEMPITHELLSEVLSLARETVSKRMVRLAELGLVQKSGKHWLIQKN